MTNKITGKEIIGGAIGLGKKFIETKEEIIDEIRRLSKKYIETKEEIERQKNARKDIEKALEEKMEADFMNKKIFLDNNAELTGLSLEFRNIFGIEGGVYEEKKYTESPFFYPEGTQEIYKYDSHLLVSACGEITELGEVKQPENSPFFVDKNRNQEGSPYYIPFCPPNLSVWCGNKYYPGFTKMFYKTENTMVNFLETLNNSTDTTFISEGTINKNGFNCENPVEFYSDSSGSIKGSVYTINADTNSSSFPKAPGGGFYTPSGIDLVKEETGYSYIKNPETSDLEVNDIISFKLTKAKGISDSKIGYAYIYKIDGNKVYLDLFSYNGSLVSEPVKRKKYKFFWLWNPPTIVIDKQVFGIEYSKKIIKSTTVLNETLKTYEEVYLDNILHYLDRIEIPDNGTKESIKKMKDLKDSFSKYWEGEKTINSLISDIKARRNWIYRNPNGTINSSGKSSIRAQQIHDNLRNSEVFNHTYNTLNTRINKRTGTLRELMKYAFNASVTNSITKLKRESITSFGKYLVVFPLVKDVKDTDYIEIQLEEGETINDLYAYMKWKSEIFIVTDDKKQPFFKSRIADIEERGEKALGIFLTDRVPPTITYKTSDNARLVRIF
jgi:hypothetical protein